MMNQDISELLDDPTTDEVFAFLGRIEDKNAAILDIIQKTGRSYEDLRGEEEPTEAVEFNRLVDAAQEEGTELVLFLLKHTTTLVVELLHPDMPQLHPDLATDLQFVMDNMPGPFDGKRDEVLNEFAQNLFASSTEEPAQSWINIDRAAEIIGCSRSSVEYLIYKKRFPAEMRGRQWFVDEAAVRAYERSPRSQAFQRFKEENSQARQ